MAIAPDQPETAHAQRRTLNVLVGAQLLSGAGLAAGITVGALLAQDLLGSTALSGLPTALFAAGGALAAAAVGRVSQLRGRRPGLALGYLAGALGAVGVIVAAVLGSAVLLLASLFVYGAGNATNLQARYAGADLAAPANRGRAVSTVLVATTLGAVAGPNLVGVMGDVADALSIPRLAGPFLLAAVAYGAAAAILAVALRPDPLLLAREHAATAPVPPKPGNDGGGHRSPGSAPGVRLGATTMVVTQIVMAAIMTMTPIHMKAHGHGLGATGLVIAIHIGAMYLPSPLSGWLVDRLGSRVVAGLAGLTLLAASFVAWLAPESSVPWLAFALGLLGLGWSLGLVAGTTAVAENLPLDRRARTQGSVDVLVSLAGAGAGVLSGVVVSTWSYGALCVLGGVVAVLLVAALALVRARPQR
ncbi:MFS transporter [Sanguibacter hominis]|uniref:MFS transporter n=1 Tax=Sanguibacter hominis TaxID=1312739 RepID=UPI003306C61F